MWKAEGDQSVYITKRCLCTNATNVPMLMLSPFSMLWGLNSVEMFVGEQNFIVTATTHMLPISTYIFGEVPPK